MTTDKEFRDAVLDHFITAFHGYDDTKSVYENISDLIVYHMEIALDPMVSKPAAKVLEDKEREIAELKDELVSYKKQVQYWKDFCEKVKKIDYNDYFLLQAKNRELAASINDLREALKYHTEQTRPIQKTIDALSTTPAQSLQAHDDEVIERCAQVCWNETDKDNIRALKT